MLCKSGLSKNDDDDDDDDLFPITAIIYIRDRSKHLCGLMELIALLFIGREWLLRGRATDAATPPPPPSRVQ